MDTDKTKKVSASNIKLAFWLVTILFFMWGVSYGLIDVMNKNFQNQLGITKATSGLLQAAYFGGYFVIATPAALVARKFGFKGGIIMGLALYAIGALLIIPASNAYSFNMFLGAFFILACGLGSLETNANPYITKLGSDKDAAFRINIAQIFNGVGQFLGPIIGGALFLSVTHGGDVADNMRSVQMVYVGIAAIIIIMLLLFVFNKLPEGSEVSGSTDSPADNEVSYAKLFSYRHFRLGALSQFLYIAAQVGAGAFFINYSVDHWSEVTDSQAAFFFSIALVAFMIGPPITAYLLTDKLKVMIGLSLVLGAVASIIGFHFARFFDISIAGSIAVAIGVIFLLTLIFSPKKGLIFTINRKRNQKMIFSVRILLIHLSNHVNTKQEKDECGIDTIDNHLRWNKGFLNKVIEKEEINKNTKLIDIKTSTINSVNYVILIFEKSK